MCISCHRKYDITEATIKKRREYMRGNTYTKGVKRPDMNGNKLSRKCEVGCKCRRHTWRNDAI
jgi:hypothetical protein